MCSLLSEIGVPLSSSDPSPSPTEMVSLLHRYEPSYTLIQTVLVALLNYSSDQVHSPDVGPLPTCRAHDVFLALSLLPGNVRPEEFTGGPVTSRHSQLVLKNVVLEGAQSAVQVVAQTEGR